MKKLKIHKSKITGFHYLVAKDVVEAIEELQTLATQLVKNGTITKDSIGEITRILEGTPYTAQASTGDMKYGCCKCPVSELNPLCLICDRPVKPIKPEVKDCKPIVNKDMREKIANMIWAGSPYVDKADARHAVDQILELINK